MIDCPFPTFRKLRPRSGIAAAAALAVLLCTVGNPHLAEAQAGFARIRGTVVDPQQSVVPNAQVTLTNEETGTVAKVSTTGQGDYTFPEVKPGRYDLSVAVAGFSGFAHNGLVLNADQNLTVPVRLTVGSANSEVTVQSEGTQVDTQTGTIKATIDAKSIEDLPLVGRDVRQLLALQQGTIEAGSTFNSNNQSSTIPGAPSFVVNGGRGNTVNFLLDGVDNNDPYTNVSNPYPDPDAISEFSVQVSNFDAEYGRNSGAIVNAITKSGTNHLHGSIYEFLRDSTFGLDASDWFSAHNKVKEPFLIQNQFGGSLGGPVVLPKLYNGHDKTFFFGSYQKTITHQASSNASETVPNAAQRVGDLSGIPGITVKDPLTGLAFPNNVIPAARLDPAAQQFIKSYLPLPNTASDLNPNLYTFRQPSLASQGELTLRGDQTLPKQNQLEMRFYQFTFNNGSLSPQPGNLAYATAGDVGSVNNAALILTTTLTPHLVNLLSFGYAHTYTHPAEPPSGYPTSETLGLNIYSVAPNPLYFSITGWTGATAVYQGLPNNRNNFPLSEAVNYQFGKHSLAFGGQITRQQQFWKYNQAFPNFSFTGDVSGYGLGDFLLGYPFQTTEANTQVLNTRYTEWSAFAQDNWKISQRLTIDAGLRWEPYLPPHFVGAFNPVSVFSPQAERANMHSVVYPNAPPGLFFSGDRGVPEGGTSATYGNFSPRVGFSYDLTGHQRTVIRGAYGYFIDQPKDIIDNRFTNGQPFNIFEQLNNSTTNPYSWRDPYRGGVDLVGAFAAQANNPGRNAQFTTPIQGELTFVNFHMPYIQQWNLTLEQQLPLNTVGRISYVGSKGTHLLWTRDINAPQRQAGPSANWADKQTRTPYNPYYGFINGLNWDGYSSYEGLQFNLEHRFSHGLSTTLNYAYSRSFDSNSDGQEFIATGIQDPYNLKLEYGPSDFDVPDNFEGSVVYDLPIPSTHSRVADEFVRGWQLNSILSVHSGQPYSIYVPCDCELTNESYERAKVYSSPSLPQNRPEAQRVQKYFNTLAYSDPALLANPATAGTAYSYTPDNDSGISARNSGRQPRYGNVDLSAFKNFDLEHTETQFRVQAFNAFNNPSLGVNTQSQYFSSPVFGQLSTAKPGRIVEFAIHVAF